MYKYSLDKTSKKFICPQCQKKRLVKYKDNSTDKYLADHVGRCDRESKCDYHYTPKQYFEKHPQSIQYVNDYKVPPVLPTSYVDFKLFEQQVLRTQKEYAQCHFFNYLRSMFTFDEVVKLFCTYDLTISHHWKGSVIFWQFDYHMKIRTGKIMQYDSKTGKRVKKPFNHIYWVHSALKKRGVVTDFNLVQCFFGEHLLERFPQKEVCIVESEKTACIMSLIEPNYVWLATGGSNGTKWREPNVLKVLQNRSVILFPDLGQFDNWSLRADLMNEIGLNVKVSTLLEEHATQCDKSEGLDIADYAISNKWYSI
jgi:hypothetical protein